MARRTAKRALLESLVRRVPAAELDETRRTLVLEIELSDPLPRLSGDAWTDAYVVVRLHGTPLGLVLLEIPTEGVTEDDLLHALTRELGTRLTEHLDRDNLRSPRDPAPSGSSHSCLEELLCDDSVPRVTVIVPTRNRPELLETCLTSVLACDYPDLEVVVVDNAPSDDLTDDMVRKQFGDDPRVVYEQLMTPGASAARNHGARIATGEILAFTDDDAVVDRLWVRALVHGFRTHPNAACVSGLTLPDALDSPVQQAFEAYGGMALGVDARLYGLHEKNPPTLLYPYTAGIFGASNNAALRRDLFLELGGFDEALGPATPAYGAEDLDLFLSVILSDREIYYEPRAIVRHSHRDSLSDLYWQVFTYSAGFSAFLTKRAVADRRVAGDLLRRVPPLLPAALLRRQRGGPESGIDPYPQQLRWLERVGYLYGPVAFLRARRAGHRRANGVTRGS